MKRTFTLLWLVLLAASCQFTGSQSAPAGSEDASGITLEGVLGKLKELAETAIDKGWIDTTRSEAGRPADTPEEEAPAAPGKVDAWYAHDFSLVYVKRTYVGTSATVPQSDETVLITHVGDKCYFQTKQQGAIRKCAVFETTPAGYKNTIYEGGKATWTHEYEGKSLTGAIADELRMKYSLLASIPNDYDMSQAREGSRCGRPCRIITLEEDTTLGRGHLISTIWLDKEYGFVYGISIKGTNDLGQKVDMQSFEITSFTDKPTAKDVPNPAQTGGGAAANLKKQLQDQLNAAKK